MKTVCIVGLSLGGNKGGPAILSSIVSLLRAQIDPLRIRMVSSYMPGDRLWQEHYGVELIPRPKPAHFWKLLTMYRGSDLVIDMHGVKFGGSRGLVYNLYASSTLIGPKMMGIPVVAYTQTYGPMDDTLTRFSARIALGAADLLFAREPQSIAVLDGIGLAAKSQLYPDVALTLLPAPLDSPRCSPDLLDFISRPFLGVAISNKVVHEESRRGLAPRYETLMTDFIRWLLNQGHRIALIPHAHVPYVPADDDYALTQRVYEQISAPQDRLYFVRDDLLAEEFKTVISRSALFVGSRYHTLVAALSTGVPSLSIGWNHKYDGLLGLFGMETFSTWADRVTLDTLCERFEDLLSNRTQYSTAINNQLPHLKQQVEESIRRVVDLL